MLRVLQVIGKMDRAGAETIIMNIYRNIDRSKVQFDFMVFSSEKGDYDDEILQLGRNIYRMTAFKGYNYFRLCEEFRKFFEEIYLNKSLNQYLAYITTCFLLSFNILPSDFIYKNYEFKNSKSYKIYDFIRYMLLI